MGFLVPIRVCESLSNREQLKEFQMWRAFFSAIGIVLLVFGLECLVIERAVLANREDSIAQQARVQAASLFSVGSSQEPVTQIFRPSEWLPWGLLATGATICLYTMSKKDQ